MLQPGVCNLLSGELRSELTHDRSPLRVGLILTQYYTCTTGAELLPACLSACLPALRCPQQTNLTKFLVRTVATVCQ